RDLSEKVGKEAEKIGQSVAALAEIDLALAKARYSTTISGVEPNLVALGESQQSPIVRLENARHPLLVGPVVPISVHLGDGYSTLVLTGPNTGGKTVSLKTIGLLTLMAQAGLHVPADEGSQIRVYSSIFADIGDEQSIEQNLSTFSSHMSHIIGILKRVDEDSLVLLDELGAGTDPSEGSALARALLATLLLKGATSVAATHYPELKTFAHATPGVENACVEFDPETLAPTYRLSIGLPGRSNALAIAARLGLAPVIIDKARSFLDINEVQMDSLLAEIQAERERAAVEREAARTAKEEAVQLEVRLEEELADLRRERGKLLVQARVEIEEELAEVRQRLQRATRTLDEMPVRRELLQEVATEVRAAEKELAQQPPMTLAEPVGDLREGDVVLVKSLNRQGHILSGPDEDGTMEVQVGNFRLRVSPSDLERRPVASSPLAQPLIEYPRRRMASEEIEVRGWRVEDVLPVVDKFLDEAYLAGLPSVRIIHGKGTGTLRRVVREQLAASPLVQSFHTAEQRAGGEGVTIAVLAH
ncbi:MAG: Smr/MutS family protein, partial [Chloroflexota bacterium]